MHNHAGVYRSEQLLKEGCDKMTEVATHLDENLLVGLLPPSFFPPSLPPPSLLFPPLFEHLLCMYVCMSAHSTTQFCPSSQTHAKHGTLLSPKGCIVEFHCVYIPVKVTQFGGSAHILELVAVLVPVT